MTRTLILIFACALSREALAQTAARGAVESRIRQYAGGPRRPLEAAPGETRGLQKGSGPVVLALGRAAAVPGAVRVTLPQVLDRAAASPGSRFYVLAPTVSEAVEAAVLLRLAGYDATALAEVPAESDAASAPAPGAAASSPTPDSAGQSRGTAAPPVAAAQSSLVLYLAIALAVTLLLVAGFAVNHFLLVPRRKTRSLLEALALIESQPADTTDTTKFREAERLLSDGTTAGMKPADLAEARFWLAYVRARLGDAEPAATVLGELLRDTPDAPADALYLDLWLQVKRKQFEAALRRWEQSKGVLASYLDATALAGIALLHEAELAIAGKDFATASMLFKEMRRLGVYLDRIPADLDDQNIMLGVDALFDDKAAEAATAFETARKAAQSEGRPTLSAEIGLLICRWRTEELPDIDADLGELVQRLAEATPPPEPPPQKAEGDAAPELPAARKFLRDVAFWHAISLLYAWIGRLPEKGGLPENERQLMRERIQAVLQVDAEYADAQLVSALIGYYFASSDTERERELGALEKATAAGAAVPDITVLLQRENKLAELRKDRVKDFLELVKYYLQDRSIPAARRRNLQAAIGGSQRGGELAAIEIVDDERSEEASVRDITGSSRTIERRIASIMKGLLEEKDGGAKEVSGLLEKLRLGCTAFAGAAEEVSETQQNLMMFAGEFLLKDEETRAAAPPQPPPLAPVAPAALPAASEPGRGGRK